MLVQSAFSHINPPMPNPPPVTLEDFIDLDLFATPSSRESSASPSIPMPPSPAVVFQDDPNSIWSFLSNSKEQQAPLFPSSSGQTIADFLSALTTSTNSASPDTSGVGSFSPASSHISPPIPPSSFAIDPQLTIPATPAQSTSDLEDESDEEDEPVIRPVKVGGKAKSQRKGTVASGGITKRTGGGGTLKDSNHQEPEDWRPSPEEYKKLSSKEKRQLRNKISARNFRVRRKEYISTLEGDIAERDRLISAIREELGTSRLENAELRRELEALKKAMLEGRTGDALPPPAPILTTRPASRPALMPKANTQKDVAPTSPRSTKSFWGGASPNFGGITPVHTTFVPDLNISASLSGKPANRTQYIPNYHQQENINPLLNTPAFAAAKAAAMDKPTPVSDLEGFSDANNFTLRSMDAYRKYLWTKVAREAGQAEALRDQQLASTNATLALRYAFNNAASSPCSSSSSSSSSSSPSPSSTSSYNSLLNHIPNTNTPLNLRPTWLATPTHLKAGQTPTLAAMLAGKGTSNTTPARLPVSSAVSQNQAQTAMLAAMASQTLISRMGSAFWDAFSGGSSALPAMSPVGLQRNWDVEKVQKVLEGRAVVRVIDVEALPPQLQRPPSKLSSDLTTSQLEESMRSMSIGSSSREDEKTPKKLFKHLASRVCPAADK